jgi:hypothetical protein
VSTQSTEQRGRSLSRDSEEEMTELGRRGLEYYERVLRAELEREHMGQAVAIHVPTGDYALGRTHWHARRALLERHPPDGQAVVLRIGPPTEADMALAERIVATRK